MTPIRVLFVCMGNICRSPMAEATFRHLVSQADLEEQFLIDSAGTGAWHSGEPPHRGTLAVLERNNIDPGSQRARQIRASDLHEFDYIVAMDDENLIDIRKMHNSSPTNVYRLLDFAPQTGERNVPDPYYNGGFDYVYNLVLAGCSGLLQFIRDERSL